MPENRKKVKNKISLCKVKEQKGNFKGSNIFKQSLVSLYKNSPRACITFITTTLMQYYSKGKNETLS